MVPGSRQAAAVPVDPEARVNEKVPTWRTVVFHPSPEESDISTVYATQLGSTRPRVVPAACKFSFLVASARSALFEVESPASRAATVKVVVEPPGGVSEDGSMLVASASVDLRLSLDGRRCEEEPLRTEEG